MCSASVQILPISYPRTINSGCGSRLVARLAQAANTSPPQQPAATNRSLRGMVLPPYPTHQTNIAATYTR